AFLGDYLWAAYDKSAALRARFPITDATDPNACAAAFLHYFIKNGAADPDLKPVWDRWQAKIKEVRDTGATGGAYSLRSMTNILNRGGDVRWSQGDDQLEMDGKQRTLNIAVPSADETHVIITIPPD
ncbi:hypothetical protein N4Q63_27930, partial [Leclercia adecarboxylata]|uniref:hypothetical protein n=1 Tax=Leclercia adecarboxylata TaxID=83655 RepID=UPI00234DFEC5|nr:hypothetical protein [Leclercia adecarboxylata]